MYITFNGDNVHCDFSVTSPYLLEETIKEYKFTGGKHKGIHIYWRKTQRNTYLLQENIKEYIFTVKSKNSFIFPNLTN